MFVNFINFFKKTSYSCFLNYCLHNISLSIFYFNLPLLLYLKWASYRQYIVDSCFKHNSQSLFLSGILRLFSFNVMITILGLNLLFYLFSVCSLWFMFFHFLYPTFLQAIQTCFLEFYVDLSKVFLSLFLCITSLVVVLGIHYTFINDHNLLVSFYQLELSTKPYLLLCPFPISHL